MFCVKVCEYSGYEDTPLTGRPKNPILPPPQSPDRIPKEEGTMRKAAVRGRRAEGSVSPGGKVCRLKLESGNELWFVRRPNGEPDEESIGVIRPGENGWPVIERVIRRAYGVDDVESWAMTVIGRSLVLSRPISGPVSSTFDESPPPPPPDPTVPPPLALTLIRP